MSDRSKSGWPRRILFIITIIALASEIAILKVAGEPYPFIRQPGFQGSAGYANNQIQYRDTDIYFISNDEELEVSRNQLLEQFPTSSHAYIMEYALTPPEIAHEGSVAANSWTETRTVNDHIFPGYRYGSRHLTSASVQKSIADWLQQRGEKIYPGKKFRAVEVRYFDNLLTLPVTAQKPSRELVTTLTIPLQ